MRTKKLFSLLLAVLMLCSLSVSAFAAETAQASVPVVLTVVNSVSPISVSVPACLPVTVLDGYVVTASNAVIENRAQSGAVQVVAVDVQPGAFAIGDYENFGSEAGKIAFSINGCKTVKEGKLTLTDGAFPVIDAGKNLRIAYTAKVTATEKVEKVNAATLIFTIAPAAGSSLQFAGTGRRGRRSPRGSVFRVLFRYLLLARLQIFSSAAQSGFASIFSHSS